MATTKTKAARVIQFAEIEQRFQLAPFQLFGIDGLKTYPAVTKKQNGTYSIRVGLGVSTRGDTVTEKFDYFYVDPDGTITGAPRGYAKDYRPGRISVEELDAAVAKYAEAASR